MSQMFDLDKKELVELVMIMRKQPKVWNRAATNLLNSFAFGNRQESIKVIRTRMTVRNERFLSSSLRVEKAKTNQKLASKIAEVGSIRRDRFSGWAEQELGTATKQTRSQSLLARGGSTNKVIRPGVRMKPAKNYERPENFNGQDLHHRNIVMMQTLRRRKYRKPFVIHGHKRIRSGLYKFHSRKLMILQDFKAPKGPKRVKWLSGGEQKYFAKNKPSAVWREALKREMKRGRR